MHEDAIVPHILPESFYARDTVTVARELLGCTLVSRAGGVVTSGRIVETEAYLGADDPGSHAATKGVTKRNAVMYGPPGRAYVYFTYGNHHMLNVVTEQDGIAGAVLIRAVEPRSGFEVMLARRMSRRKPGTRPLTRFEVADGPGKLACAFGIDLACNGQPLGGSATLSVLGPPDAGGEHASSGRVGLSRGRELQLRFYFDGDPYVSGAHPGLRPSRSRTRKGATT